MVGIFREVTKNTHGMSARKVTEHKESWWWHEDFQAKTNWYKELLSSSKGEEIYKEAKQEASKEIAKVKSMIYEEM